MSLNPADQSISSAQYNERRVKNKYYIFCHGFGFDRSFWRFLQPYFQNQRTFYCDQGYFGARLFPEHFDTEQFDFIGVGHSFGFRTLLSLPVSWACLIGLQGFFDFLGYEKSLRARRYREWQVLKAQLKRAPEKTLKAFYQRAGVSFSPKWSDMSLEQLLNDLEQLSLPATSLPKKAYFLGALDDRVVPPEVLDDHMRQFDSIHLSYLSHGGHALGFDQPAAIYRYILGVC